MFPLASMLAAEVRTLVLGPSITSNEAVIDPPPVSETVTAGIRLNRDGTVEYIDSGSWVFFQQSTQWVDNVFKTSTIGDEFEARITGSGDTLSGTGSTSFQTLNQTLNWQYTRNTYGISTWNGTLEIREITNTSNSVSATVTIQADLNSGV